MKSLKVLTLAASIGILASASLMAADHKTPVAPKDYLDMKSTVKDSKDVVERDQKLYERKCKKCHGEKGDGKGSAADKLEIKPVAFTAPGYMKGKSDGQLFFITEKGSPNTDMEAFGPGTESNLAKDDMWSIIAYMRKAFTK